MFPVAFTSIYPTMEKFFTTVFNFDKLIFVHVLNIRFICDDKIYLLTYKKDDRSLKLIFDTLLDHCPDLRPNLKAVVADGE